MRVNPPYVDFVYNTIVPKSTREISSSTQLTYCSPTPTCRTSSTRVHSSFGRKVSESPHERSCDPASRTTKTRRQFFQENVRKTVPKRRQVVALLSSVDKIQKLLPPMDPIHGTYLVVRKINEVNYKMRSERNKKKNQIVHYDRLTPLYDQKVTIRLLCYDT